MSETTGTERIGETEEREDPSLAGKPEIPAGRLEEREQRQHAEQQHGDTFAVDSEEPTDTSGITRGASNRVTALPGDQPAGEGAREEDDES